ncbi:hypothetical protein ASPACDRAFT_80319 [Aspergillus aculeatus ATCC 16872]|uniref:DUF7702 domain-containing protein n=1 Tax=Aspergillus aculeatus (strain ATCC 16872 / CBS 172.66 / WB 5094) TaxID=690307 RepID=A0A1L9WMM6_ASPA1|nr:uncharacterized protein ASPACDRAFT_80319 [Aspergillus aculeatus ATCC 16872]OJJ97426.1 hypothetical protein ASPACDRAFT_80319 [Aspergillus aculeatus ATCC 16872]
MILTNLTVRVAAGILVISFEHKRRTGIMVASIILLNTGVFPLIAATLGFIRIILAHEKEVVNPRVNRCLMFSRMLFFVGLGLQIAGGCLEGSDSASDVATGVKLVKAGYSIVVVFAACLLLVQAYFWMHLPDLSHMSSTVSYCLGEKRQLRPPAELTAQPQILKAMALALPFLIVRIAYLFLSVFHATDLRWNDLVGPIAPFVLMGLSMEYAVVWIYLGTGFLIPSWRELKGDRVVSMTRYPLVEQV